MLCRSVMPGVPTSIFGAEFSARDPSVIADVVGKTSDCDSKDRWEVEERPVYSTGERGAHHIPQEEARRAGGDRVGRVRRRLALRRFRGFGRASPADIHRSPRRDLVVDRHGPLPRFRRPTGAGRRGARGERSGRLPCPARRAAGTPRRGLTRGGVSALCTQHPEPNAYLFPNSLLRDSSSSSSMGLRSSWPTAVPRCTAGRAATESNQRLTLGKSFRSWPCFSWEISHG